MSGSVWSAHRQRLPVPRDRARRDGSGQIGQPRPGGRAQQRAQDDPAQPRERPGLGFVAEDDGAQAAGRGAERERVLGVQPPGVRDEGEGMRRSLATTVLRSAIGCAFHRKDAGRAAGTSIN